MGYALGVRVRVRVRGRVFVRVKVCEVVNGTHETMGLRTQSPSARDTASIVATPGRITLQQPCTHLTRVRVGLRVSVSVWVGS